MPKILATILLALSLATLSLGLAEGQTPTIAASDKGVEIDGGSMGKFLFVPPRIALNPKDYNGETPVIEMQGADTLICKYPSGADLKMTASPAEKSITCAFENIPNGARGFVFQMRVPISFANGGKFAFNNGALQLFPEQKDKQIFGQGTATLFTLIDPLNQGFRLVTPMDYQQVQDNRVFNWPIFLYIYNYTFASHSGKSAFAFRVEPFDAATAQVQPGAPMAAPGSFAVDRYGQSVRKDFPGKVRSDEELKADVDKQKAALLPPSGPKEDSYGGLAGSGEQLGLEKTGFFRVGKKGDRQFLVTPEGNMFFQLGVCGISLSDDYTLVTGREKHYEWLPPHDAQFESAWRPQTPGVVSFYIANWIRKFGRPFTLDEWSGQVVDRLRAWGFNSGGAFSQYTETMRAKGFPYVAHLPSGQEYGARMLPDKVGAAEVIDPFAPGAEEALDKAFAAKVAPRATDPLLIGYFLGNEQHFEILPKLIPTYKAGKVAAKARLVEFLKEKYPDIGAFNTAWGPAKPFASFDELGDAPLFVRSEAGAGDMKEYTRLYLEAYYSMVTRVFRKYDPHHLLIGSRWTPGTASNEDVVRIGGKYLDVVSVNYYTYPIEKDFLDRVHEWSGGRPIILSEWYYSSTEEGLGAGKEVKNQKERGAAYRNYVEQSAALPYVVGSQWFIFNDQSITGRFFEGLNGEGNNTGLISVADRPYEDLVAATRETGGRIYDVMMGKQPAFAFNDARFNGKGQAAHKVVSIPKALPGLKFDGTTTNWPGRPTEPIEPSRLVFGNPNEKLRGDYRLCWDDKAFYFLIQVKDPTPQMNDREAKSLWSADGIELFLGAGTLSQGGSMIFSDRQILLGAGKEPKVFIADHPEDSAKCQLLVVKDVSGDGYVLEAAIPWNVLGVKPTTGQELLFDVGIDNSDDGQTRKQQLMWNGSAKNSGDRAAWGRARLVEN